MSTVRHRPTSAIDIVSAPGRTSICCRWRLGRRERARAIRFDTTFRHRRRRPGHLPVREPSTAARRLTSSGAPEKATRERCRLVMSHRRTRAPRQRRPSEGFARCWSCRMRRAVQLHRSDVPSAARAPIALSVLESTPQETAGLDDFDSLSLNTTSLCFGSAASARRKPAAHEIGGLVSMLSAACSDWAGDVMASRSRRTVPTKIGACAALAGCSSSVSGSTSVNPRPSAQRPRDLAGPATARLADDSSCAACASAAADLNRGVSCRRRRRAHGAAGACTWSARDTPVHRRRLRVTLCSCGLKMVARASPP